MTSGWDGRHPSSPTTLPQPAALELVITLKIQKMVCGKGGRGAGGRGDLYCGLEMYFLKDAQLCSTKQNSTCSLKKIC